MKARKVMDVYTWLVAPLGLGFLYVSVPPSEFRNGLSALVFAIVLGLFMIVLFGAKFWLDLRHADAAEGTVRDWGWEKISGSTSGPAQTASRSHSKGGRTSGVWSWRQPAAPREPTIGVPGAQQLDFSCPRWSSGSLSSSRAGVRLF